MGYIIRNISIWKSIRKVRGLQHKSWTEINMREANVEDVLSTDGNSLKDI